MKRPNQTHQTLASRQTSALAKTNTNISRGSMWTIPILHWCSWSGLQHTKRRVEVRAFGLLLHPPLWVCGNSYLFFARLGVVDARLRVRARSYSFIRSRTYKNGIAGFFHAPNTTMIAALGIACCKWHTHTVPHAVSQMCVARVVAWHGNMFVHVSVIIFFRISIALIGHSTIYRQPNRSVY